MASSHQSGERKTSGILQRPAPGESGRSAKGKVTIVPLKMTVRHLPPGLTEQEFMTIIGEQWLPNNGKVDWMSYDEGKVS
jgi:regulator of nonsense transcripts 3